MIKNKMKSLLAAALAGALTVSAIPVNASAVVSKFKYSGYEHSHAGDILNELGSYSDANAFDVIYEGAHHGVSGGGLEEYLTALETDSTDRGDVELINEHTVYNVKDNSDNAASGNSRQNLLTFPVDVKSYAMNAFPDPLHEVSSWRMWVGDSGFNDIAPVAEASTADYIETSDMVDAINALGSKYENIALQLIFKGIEFEVQYYSAFDQPLGSYYTISDENRRNLDATYCFVHYVPDVAVSMLNVSSGEEAWDFINRMVRNFNEFNQDRAKLLRFAEFEVLDRCGKSVGSFSSGHCDEYEYNKAFKYVKSGESSDTLWLVSDGSGAYPMFSASGDKLEETVNEFLAQHTDVQKITLRMCPEMYVTSSSCFDGDVLADLSQFKQYNVTELPAKAADLSSVLDLQEHYGFDFENWKLFEGVSTGENGGCRLSELANDKDGFGIDSISGIAAGSVLVAYIPQEELPDDIIPQVEITVAEPEIGVKFADTADIPSGADYAVDKVSWYRGETLDTSGEFAAGEQYTVSVTLSPEKYFAFDGTTTAKVNGHNAVIRDFTANELVVEYTFDKLPDDIWGFVDGELAGEHPVISMPDGEIIPGEVMQKIKNSGREVELNYGDYSWIITGFDADYTAKPIDLRIMRVAESNWAEAVKTASGHLYKMQISIQHSGDFGFTALLKLNLSDGKPANPGTYYANLYQLSGDQLKWSVYSDLAEESGKYIAKLEFTHASDWLVTIDSEINPGSGNDGGSTGGSGNRVNGIKKARTLKSEGWDNIVKEIKSTGEGSVIEITLNDETTMPEDALQAAIDRKMKLIMDAGFGRIWEIDGAKAVPGKYIDLSISGVDVGIPEDSYAGILCSDSRQLRINARLLNFTAQLTAFIGKDNIGQNAALYSYNDETGKLVFQDISAVDRDGNVIFNIKCGGRYFIALGSKVAPPAYLCGDVNGDGVVNAHDAAAILKYATYGYPLDKRCGDTNADGAVDAHDALPILNYVVGNVKLLPAVGFRQ